MAEAGDYIVAALEAVVPVDAAAAAEIIEDDAAAVVEHEQQGEADGCVSAVAVAVVVDTARDFDYRLADDADDDGWRTDYYLLLPSVCPQS